MKISIVPLLISVSALSVHGYTLQPQRPVGPSPQPHQHAVARRQAMGAILAGGPAMAFLVAPPPANALDMDAFANAQIDADKKNCNPKVDPKCAPPLTKDEALCKYGQSGDARGEACKRVKRAGGELPSAKPAGKSLGGAYAM